MRIDILYPAIPPAQDAIGEHNALLAAALRQAGATVGLIHVGHATSDKVDGVDLVTIRPEDLRCRSGLTDTVLARRPDWLITGYNPFSYGRYGFNPWLPLMLDQVRRCTDVRLALYIHEGFVPTTGVKSAIMGLMQRRQLQAIGRSQDIVLTSIERWVERFAPLFPGKELLSIPVGSNLPFSTKSRRDSRCDLGIRSDARVIALFGGLSSGRDLPALREVLARIDSTDVSILYAGPSGHVIGDLTEDLRLRLVNLGRAPAQRVALALNSADLGLALFSEGVSERRGSFLAMLQQGLATVTTSGEHTGTQLRAAAGCGAFVLSESDPSEVTRHVLSMLDDVQIRDRMSELAYQYYMSHHDWSRLADRYVDLLGKRMTVPCQA